MRRPGKEQRLKENLLFICMNGLKPERETLQAFASLNNASSLHDGTFLQPVGVLGRPQQNPQLEQNVVAARRRPEAFPSQPASQSLSLAS